MASDGDKLGRYHLIRKLATGGMAEVFLAKVMGPGGFEKSLVIKRMRPQLAKDPEFVSLFLQEARLAAQFAHPAVVQIFDFGEVNGAYFLAMEYVDGPNLRTLLRAAPQHRLALPVGARVIEEACEGLAYVHEFADASGAPLGLMHCDVSTDNLMIARNGAVKVVDFGVAKAAGEASNAAPGTVKGKIAYMPPEQIIGEADLRADVYALGVILYELASGTRPYEQLPDQQLLAAIIQTDPVPLLARQPDVPREYANIVSKAMAKNLAHRFQSCRELAAALEEFIARSGQRVGTRQLAALASQVEELNPPRPSGGGTPAQATPAPRPQEARISPPRGVAPVQPPPRGDPFAAFGVPLAARPSAPPPASKAAPAPGLRSEDLFDDLVSELDALKPAPAPRAAPAPEPEPELVLEPEPEPEPEGMRVTIGASGAGVPLASLARGPRPPTSAPVTAAAPPPATSGSGMFSVRPSAPAPQPPPAPPPPARSPLPMAHGSPPAPPSASPAGGFSSTSSRIPLTTASGTRPSPEVRSAVVMADATAMRLYEPGAPLTSEAEQDALRREVERDEGLHLLVRFPCLAHRLLTVPPEPGGVDLKQVVSERVSGAVEGLLLAEAWGTLATLLERLRAAAGQGELQRGLYDFALGHLTTADQARRIAARLREAPPPDAEGLGALLPFFGPGFATAWLELFETLDLPASRDAVLPGLAGLAGLNPEPFVERLSPKRPRRIAELVYCLEQGKVGERQRLTRDLLKRLDPARRREVLTGLARAGSDDAFRAVFQAVVEEGPATGAANAEGVETRVHALLLLGKHFPQRVYQALEPMLGEPSASWSEAARRALWNAVGHSSDPAALVAVEKELAARAPLLGRARADARKVDALEALAVMGRPEAVELLKRTAEASAQSQVVRAAADGHLRSAALIESTTTHAPESRRWERNPITWRDVLLDLGALAGASRLVELDSATFDVAFARLSHALSVLLPAGAVATVTCGPALSVDGAPLAEGADPALERVERALSSRGVAGFTFTRRPPRAELEDLVRWLAAGGPPEGVSTPSITLRSTGAGAAAPRPSVPKVPAMGDPSREALVRYVDLVLAARAWLGERKLRPGPALPEVTGLLAELVGAMSSGGVRFAGLTPRRGDRDAELFHSANVLTLSLLFAAELGMREQLGDLARYAFFADVANLTLPEALFERAGNLNEAEQRQVAAARQASWRLPFLQLGDRPGATAWACALLEQEVDWGTRDAPGGMGAQASVGLLGGVVALCRVYELLTTASARHEAMTRDQALEVLTTKVPHRFRPELLLVFARFLKRLSSRPLNGG